MSHVEEIKCIFREVKDNYWSRIASYASAPAVLITSIFSIKFLGTTYDGYYLSYAIIMFFLTFLAIFFILTVITAVYYYKRKFNPIKVTKNKYKLIIRFSVKYKQDGSIHESPERRIVMNTHNLLVNDQTTARYTFTLKISENVKKRLIGERFTIIFHKPTTIRLSSKLKSKWDQKYKESPDEQFFCLDQKYEGSSNELKFKIQINSESMDSHTEIKIFFEYGSKLEDVGNDKYKLTDKFIHCEKIHFMEVNVIDPASKDIHKLITT
jgi:hypothetical protein